MLFFYLVALPVVVAATAAALLWLPSRSTGECRHRCCCPPVAAARLPLPPNHRPALRLTASLTMCAQAGWCGWMWG